jgi:hypothetical protein
MFATIVETAIISVAAIVISALATGNAIHARMFFSPKELKKELMRRRAYCIERRAAWNGDGDEYEKKRNNWEQRMNDIDIELLPLTQPKG